MMLSLLYFMLKTFLKSELQKADYLDTLSEFEEGGETGE